MAWGFVAVVAILHFDFWLWTDKSLLFGFLPVGLGFQMLISILAGIAWALVIKYAWPGWIEKWAESGEDS
ncbi:MAG: hypothetical protein CMJ83_20215 [Planctomycetes bacterium]|nr:hypothetical protein [Planctomycetota bacterium]